NGGFSFLQGQPGTYSLNRAATSFVDGLGNFGNLGGTIGAGAVTGIVIAEGQAAVNYSLAVRGLAADQISLRDFLANPPATSSFFGPAGAGFPAGDYSVQPS